MFLYRQPCILNAIVLWYASIQSNNTFRASASFCFAIFREADMGTKPCAETQSQQADIRSLYAQAEALLRRCVEPVHAEAAWHMKQLLHAFCAYNVDLAQQNTHLQATQDALRHMLGHYQSLYRCAPVGFVVTDMQGVIVEVNTAFVNALGFTCAGVLQQPFEALVYDDDRQQYRKYMANVAQQAGTSMCEIRLYNAAAEPQEVQLHAAQHGSSCAGRVYINVVDMTDRNRAESERRAGMQRRHEQEYLDSLSLLASGIAHDLNNIHLVARGNAELALALLDHDDNTRMCLENIVQAIDDASHVLKHITSFAKGGTTERYPYDLAMLLGEAYPLLQSAIDSKVQLDVYVHHASVLVAVDYHQVRQMLLNLVLNAAEAMAGEEGAIHIEIGSTTLSKHDLDLCQVKDTAQPGPFGFIRLSDTGPGMDEELLSRIFAPYFSTKLNGRGLGLAMVRTIVRLHSGALHIVSAPGQGTTFTVLLPQVEEERTLEVGSHEHARYSRRSRATMQ